MKLQDVTEKIYFGLKIIEKDFLTKKNIDSESIYVLHPNDFIESKIELNDSSKFIKKQTYLKTYNNHPLNQYCLSYNDYVYSINTKKSYFYKNEDFPYVILPLDFFLIIRPIGYLNSFLSNTSALKYFEEELNKVFNSEYPNKLDLIKSIYIPDSLSEIEEINFIGIRPDKKKVDLDKIRIKQGLMTLDKVLKRMQNGEIEMNVESYFQRKANLWEADIKSRFIEALIVKQPVPAFYFDATNDDKWLIVDGLQRLTTVKQFVIDKSLKLTDLYYLPIEYENKTFDELPRPAQRSIEEYEIIAYQIEEPTPKEVKYKIFRSINTSPLKLSNQEIRHALNQGNPANWVKRLTELPIFKQTIPVNQKEFDRMLDREYALRYLSFKITHYNDYHYEIQDFLDESMTKLYKINEKDFDKYENEFGEALFAINRIFDAQAYKKSMFGIDKDNFINHIFESLTFVFSELNEFQREKLIKRKQHVIYDIKKLCKSEKFYKSIDSETPYTKENIKERFETLIKFFNEISK